MGYVGSVVPYFPGDFFIFNAGILNTVQIGDDVSTPEDILNIYANTQIGSTSYGRGLDIYVPADDVVLIDGSTHAHTGTDGVLDMDVTTGTATGVSGMNLSLTLGNLVNTAWAYGIYVEPDATAALTATSNMAGMYLADPSDPGATVTTYGLYIEAGYDFGLAILSPVKLSSLILAPTSDPTPYILDFQLGGWDATYTTVYTQGRVINMTYQYARTLDGGLSLLYADLSANLTYSANAVTGIYMDLSATDEANSNIFLNFTKNLIETSGAAFANSGSIFNIDITSSGEGGAGSDVTDTTIVIDIDYTLSTGGGGTLDLSGSAIDITYSQGAGTPTITTANLKSLTVGATIEQNAAGLVVGSYQSWNQTLNHANAQLYGMLIDLDPVVSTSYLLMVGQYINLGADTGDTRGVLVASTQGNGRGYDFQWSGTIAAANTVRGVMIDADSATLSHGSANYYALRINQSATNLATYNEFQAIRMDLNATGEGIYIDNATVDVGAAGKNIIYAGVHVDGLTGAAHFRGSYFNIDETDIGNDGSFITGYDALMTGFDLGRADLVAFKVTFDGEKSGGDITRGVFVDADLELDSATEHFYGVHVDTTGLTLGAAAAAGTLNYGIFIEMPAAYGAATEAAIYATGAGNQFGALQETYGIYLNVLDDTTLASPLYLDLEVFPTGNVVEIAYTAAEALSGALTGIDMDFSTNITMGAQVVTGMAMDISSTDDDNASIGLQVLKDGGGAVTVDRTISGRMIDLVSAVTNTTLADIDVANSAYGIYMVMSHTVDHDFAHTGPDTFGSTAIVIDIDGTTTNALDQLTMTARLMDLSYTTTQTLGTFILDATDLIRINLDVDAGTAMLTGGAGDFNVILMDMDGFVPGATFANNTDVHGIHMDWSAASLGADAQVQSFVGIRIDMPANYGADGGAGGGLAAGNTNAAIYATGNANIFSALIGDGVYVQMREATSIAVNLDVDQANDTANDLIGLAISKATTITGAADIATTNPMVDLNATLTNAGGGKASWNDYFLDIDLDISQAVDTSTFSGGFISMVITESVGTCDLQGDMVTMTLAGTIPAGQTLRGYYLDGGGVIVGGTETYYGLEIDLSGVTNAGTVEAIRVVIDGQADDGLTLTADYSGDDSAADLVDGSTLSSAGVGETWTQSGGMIHLQPTATNVGTGIMTFSGDVFDVDFTLTEDPTGSLTWSGSLINLAVTPTNSPYISGNKITQDYGAMTVADAASLSAYHVTGSVTIGETVAANAVTYGAWIDLDTFTSGAAAAAWMSAFYGMLVEMPAAGDNVWTGGKTAAIRATGNDIEARVVGEVGAAGAVGAAFYGILDQEDASNPYYGLNITKDLDLTVDAAAAYSVTNSALAVGQVMDNKNDDAGAYAITANNNVAILQLAHTMTTTAAANDTIGATLLNMVVSTTTNAGTDTVDWTGKAINLDYSINEAAGTVNVAALNVVEIDYDTTGTPAFAAGTYNIFAITGTDAAVPVYGAATTFQGMSVDLSAMDNTDANLTLYGLRITMAAAYGVAANEAAIYATGNANIFSALLGDLIYLEQGEANAIGINIVNTAATGQALVIDCSSTTYTADLTTGIIDIDTVIDTATAGTDFAIIDVVLNRATDTGDTYAFNTEIVSDSTGAAIAYRGYIDATFDSTNSPFVTMFDASVTNPTNWQSIGSKYYGFRNVVTFDGATAPNGWGEFVGFYSDMTTGSSIDNMQSMTSFYGKITAAGAAGSRNLIGLDSEIGQDTVTYESGAVFGIRNQVGSFLVAFAGTVASIAGIHTRLSTYPLTSTDYVRAHDTYFMAYEDTVTNDMSLWYIEHELGGNTGNNCYGIYHDMKHLGAASTHTGDYWGWYLYMHFDTDPVVAGTIKGLYLVMEDYVETAVHITHADTVPAGDTWRGIHLDADSIVCGGGQTYYGIDIEMDGMTTGGTIYGVYVLGKSGMYHAVWQSTDDGGTGPIERFYHNSTTVAVNDDVGIIEFVGRNAANNADVTYAEIRATVSGIGAGVETGSLEFWTCRAGASTLGAFVDTSGGMHVDALNGGADPGVAELTVFDAFNDVGLLRDFANRENIDRFVELGIMSRHPSGLTALNLQYTFQLMAGGIYQNRDYMDTQFGLIGTRFETLEEKVARLENENKELREIVSTLVEA